MASERLLPRFTGKICFQNCAAKRCASAGWGPASLRQSEAPRDLSRTSSPFGGSTWLEGRADARRARHARKIDWRVIRDLPVGACADGKHAHSNSRWFQRNDAPALQRVDELRQIRE